MLDINFIRENIDLVKKGAKDKGIKIDIAKLIKLDDQRRTLIKEFEGYKAEKNLNSKEIAKLAAKEKQKAIKKMQTIGAKEKQVSEKLAAVQEEFDQLMLQVPQPASADTPLGKDDTENQVVRTWGKIPDLSTTPKSHVEIGIDLDIIDIERGVKVAGSRSYFLKGDGARLEMAMMLFTIDHLHSKGFTLLTPPVIVNDEVMYNTGYYPGGEEDAYHLDREPLSLIGTAEVPVTSYHSEEILIEKNLPILYSGYSTCFRREAGTYGKDTHGLYRLHQFQKVEQVVLCKNDLAESIKMHEFITKNSEEIMQALELPYRVVAVCTGDLGKGQYKKYDIEAWMPSRNAYGETHSSSIFLDFQARRLRTRYKDSDGKIHYVHTLNNTALASPRTLIPFLEVHQQPDGSIKIPAALVHYMGQTIIKK